MKKVIEVLVVLLIALGLAQLLDLSFYLLNQADTFVFNIGVVTFAITFVAFGFLGVYLLALIKPEEEVKEEVKQEKEEEL